MGRANFLLMFCFAVCIVGTAYSLISSGVWFGANEVGLINAIAGINAVRAGTLGGISVPQMPFEWMNALITMISWDYPYLDNAWGFIFKLLLLYPCTLGVAIAVWEMGMAVLQGFASIARTFIP